MSKAASGTGETQKSCTGPRCRVAIVLRGRLSAFALLSPGRESGRLAWRPRQASPSRMQRRAGALIKPLGWAKRYDDLLGAGQVQHGTCTLVQKIRVEMACAQCGDPVFPFRKFLLRMREPELGRFEVLLPLRIGLQSQRPLRCVPGKIPRDEEENQRRDCRSSATSKSSCPSHRQPPHKGMANRGSYVGRNNR